MTYGRDSPIPSALRGRAGSHSNLRTNCARGSALLRNFAQKRTAWSRPRERREVPGRVYAAEKRSGPLQNTAVGGAVVEGVSASKISPTSPTGAYISPRDASDTHAPEPFPSITWSWIFRSTTWAASTSCRVSRKSSLDGAGSPDG